MIDLVALRTELDKPAYAALNNADAAVSVMNAAISVDRQISSKEIASFWARRRVLARAREAGERGATPADRIFGWAVLDIVTYDALSDLDTRITNDKTEFSSLLDNMVTAGFMNAQQRTTTLALINKARTGLEVFGYLDENDIARARAL